ncbi:hypothetical protein [Methylomonas sp. MgM2]
MQGHSLRWLADSLQATQAYYLLGVDVDTDKIVNVNQFETYDPALRDGDKRHYAMAEDLRD